MTMTLLTQAELLEEVQSLRTRVLANMHRIPKARSCADKLGNIETIILEAQAEEEYGGEEQERLPLDPPETVDRELGEQGRGRKSRSRAAA